MRINRNVSAWSSPPWRRAGRRISTTGCAPPASAWEIAAAGAIRRDPKYAGCAEMEQEVVELFITAADNAKGLPLSDAESLSLTTTSPFERVPRQGWNFAFIKW